MLFSKHINVLALTLSILLVSCTSSEEFGHRSKSTPDEYFYEVQKSTVGADDRKITYYLDRPRQESIPILVVIDGSGCSGQLRDGFKSLFRPSAEAEKPYARLSIEKPGVKSDATSNESCSDEFLKHYSISNRVRDHMRVFQHLKYHADWWNGELYLWGWSDGGDIGARLVAYYPEVTRAILGAMGGGYTMSEHFTKFWICSEEMPRLDREDCETDMQTQLDEISDSPTWKRTWSGSSNSWKAWASRLNTRLSNLLVDNSTPILIVQGTDDFDATPTESARKLVSDLSAAGNESYLYWEVPNMGHSWNELPNLNGGLLEDAMAHWLLTGEEHDAHKAKLAID